jgi:hypothetical protein
MLSSAERESFRKSLDLDDFVSESRIIIQDYKCPLCEGIYSNPVVDACGHVYCKVCIMQYMETTTLCPISGNQLDEKSFTMLVIVNNILEKQIVQCKNRNFYCEWVGKLCELAGHLACDCRRQVVTCPHDGCVAEIFREDMPTHQKLCEFRIISCDDCSLNIAFNTTKPHQDVCPKFKVPCPQECPHMIERQHVEKHINIYCMNTVIQCPYGEYGCSTFLTKKELDGYLSSNTNRHNFLVLSYMRDFHSDVNNKTSKAIETVASSEERLGKIEQLLYSLIQSKDTNRDKLKINKENADEKTKRKSRRATNSLNELSSNKIDKDVISHKRHRCEDESALNINKIDLLELSEEDKDSTLMSEVSVSENKADLPFDTYHLSKGIQIIKNKAISIGTKLEHKFLFFNTSLTQLAEWKVNINLNSEWIALGMASKELVISNKYKFISSTSNFNHGFYGISLNGYTWNASNQAENNINIKDYQPVNRDTILFSYNPEEKELEYKTLSGKLQGKLTSVSAIKASSLFPCVIFLSGGDEISLEN